MADILIIDDDELLCKTLCRHVRRMGHNASSALNLDSGLQQLSSNAFDLVFLDVGLPDGSGLHAVPHVQNSASMPEIIIITGEGDPDGAELAIRSGAWAYVEKPLSLGHLELQLTRALQYRKEKSTRKPTVVFKRERIVGSSPQLEACLEALAVAAASNANILITGETGTGKELFAGALHRNSDRADKSFVVVDCAALPENLVGSMLFGHEKGAFTGADKPRTGLIKEADGGTLFLDEIGELPLTVQRDFLRALQENRFRPLGSDKEIESDFRLVSATNRDLEKMVETGEFRKDLFYRLQTLTVEIPPLRDRFKDIKELAVHYMVKLCERYGMETKGFSPDFFDTLVAYPWPGNARELVNTIESVLTVARFEPTLFPAHLPVKIRSHAVRASVGERKSTADTPEKPIQSPQLLPPLQKVRESALSKVERQYLYDLMLLTKGDMKVAGSISGVSQSRLYFLLKNYKIRRY